MIKITSRVFLGGILFSRYFDLVPVYSLVTPIRTTSAVMSEPFVSIKNKTRNSMWEIWEYEIRKGDKKKNGGHKIARGSPSPCGQSIADGNLSRPSHIRFDLYIPSHIALWLGLIDSVNQRERMEKKIDSIAERAPTIHPSATTTSFASPLFMIVIYYREKKTRGKVVRRKNGEGIYFTRWRSSIVLVKRQLPSFSHLTFNSSQFFLPSMSNLWYIFVFSHPAGSSSSPFVLTRQSKAENGNFPCSKYIHPITFFFSVFKTVGRTIIFMTVLTAHRFPNKE